MLYKEENANGNCITNLVSNSWLVPLNLNIYCDYLFYNS